MERKNRNWFYLVPVAGAVFCLWYLYTSFYDVVYSDYIRLVNSYLLDVWNPAKFWVPDLLTRVPVNFLARIINTTFFHYSIRFDQVLGVVSLALSAVSVTYYVNRKQIGTIWFLVVMAVMFSLNKWEMLNNGSGWVHFLAFAGFYYHYQIWDRVWGREERKGDHLQMILLPWILILAVAGPYCAVYVAVLIAGYAFCMAGEAVSFVWTVGASAIFLLSVEQCPGGAGLERLWGGPRVAVPEPVPDSGLFYPVCVKIPGVSGDRTGAGQIPVEYESAISGGRYLCGGGLSYGAVPAVFQEAV